ncbi:MAG TPA: YihY/virulence factor BrkB family protein [Gaiellaceae bacterium]|jgi:membrane protein
MARTRARKLVDLWSGLIREHELITYASAIAFRALVALVALVLLAVAVLGEIGRTDVWTRQIGPHIRGKVLPDVYAGINEVVEKIFHTSSVGLIVLATVIAILQIAGVVSTCTAAISRIYGQKDDRSWKDRSPISFGISVVLTAALLGAILLGTAARTAVHGGWSIPFTILRWLVAAILIGLAFGMLVRFTPPRPRSKRWVSAGATLVVVGWVVQSLIFAEYLSLASYRSAALSLLGAYFLMTYLFVGAIVLLVGIELDELARKP